MPTVHYTFGIKFLTTTLCTYRNQAYQTRIQLSILDHNKHCQREHMRSKDGNLLYHRKYRKQSKKWDVTPTLIRKKYEYIHRLYQRYVKQEQIPLLLSKGRLCCQRSIQVVFKRPLATATLKRHTLLYQTNVPGFHKW